MRSSSIWYISKTEVVINLWETTMLIILQSTFTMCKIIKNKSKHRSTASKPMRKNARYPTKKKTMHVLSDLTIFLLSFSLGKWRLKFIWEFSFYTQYQSLQTPPPDFWTSLKYERLLKTTEFKLLGAFKTFAHQKEDFSKPVIYLLTAFTTKPGIRSHFSACTLLFQACLVVCSKPTITRSKNMYFQILNCTFKLPKFTGFT